MKILQNFIFFIIHWIPSAITFKPTIYYSFSQTTLVIGNESNNPSLVETNHSFSLFNEDVWIRYKDSVIFM